MPILTTPHKDHIPSFADALREGFTLTTDQEPFTIEQIAEIENNPDIFLDNYLHPKETSFTLPDGTIVQKIPQSQLWYMDNNQFIGRITIRHYLDDGLLNHGGHLAYSVTPSRQNQGHATNMLKESFAYCKNTLLLDRILAVIDEENIASHRTIEKVGGVLEDVRICPFDHVNIHRYWITL